MQQAQHARGWNFLPKLTFVITIGLITAATGFQARALDVFTDPVGFITLNAVGNGLSFDALGMTQIPVQRGVISAVAGQSLTVSNSMTANQYVGPGGATQFFIEITSGPFAGLTDDIVSNSTTAVFTSVDDSGEVAATETYKIYPHWTLNTAFGPPATSGLNGAATAAAADNLIVWNPTVQQNTTYFYRTAGTPGWRSTASLTVDVGTNVLYIDEGIVIQRRIAGAVGIKLVGGVKLGPTIVPMVASGLTFAGNVYASSFSLNASSLFTTNDATGVHGAATAAAADNLLIWDPVLQQTTTYFWRTAGTPGWRSTASLTTDVGTNQLSIASIIQVQRRLATPFNWVAPAPY